MFAFFRVFPVCLFGIAALVSCSEPSATPAAPVSQPAPTPPPWRVIYSNDCTNILDCDGPYNTRDPRVLTEEKIRASVREAAVDGVDAQLLQPGYCWVPWWPSKILTLAQQEAWFEAHYGLPPLRAEHEFLKQGGDIVGTFIDECRKHGKAALVSFRMNDGHHLNFVNAKPPALLRGMVAHLTQFYAEHPEYRRAPEPANRWEDRILNWAIPEVRAYKKAMLFELIDAYPQLDGIELDFQRHPFYFPDTMPMRERSEIMCALVRETRAKLDAMTARDGRRRYLGVRVPISPDDITNNGSWQTVGFIPEDWAQTGLDYFNLSPNYNTTQQTGLAEARARAPQMKIYCELTHTAMSWPCGKGTKEANYRRNTRELLYTTARLAATRGADGISIFNFPYYRFYTQGVRKSGPFCEPPFAYLSGLTDAKVLADTPSLFFLWTRELKIPPWVESYDFAMDIAPARGNGAATLRLLAIGETERRDFEAQPARPLDRGQWAVFVNGTELTRSEAPQKAYPYPTDIRAGFGKPEQYIAFDVPAGLLKDGKNAVRVEALKLSQPMRLRWIEIWQEPLP